MGSGGREVGLSPVSVTCSLRPRQSRSDSASPPGLGTLWGHGRGQGPGPRPAPLATTVVLASPGGCPWRLGLRVTRTRVPSAEAGVGFVDQNSGSHVPLGHLSGNGGANGPTCGLMVRMEQAEAWRGHGAWVCRERTEAPCVRTSLCTLGGSTPHPAVRPLQPNSPSGGVTKRRRRGALSWGSRLRLY